MTCEQCRLQMLPYLYDLLEPAERQVLTAHLESCPACQEALKAAQEQQCLLAEAVTEKSDIVFKAPVKATPASSAPTVAFRPRPQRSIFLLNRWAAAAAVLLFLFGGGGVLGWAIYRDKASRLDDANTRLAKAKQEMDKAHKEQNQKKDQDNKEIREIQKQIDELYKDWKKKEKEKLAILDEKRVDGLQIVVNSPQAIVAGGKNSVEFELNQNIDAFNQKGQQQDTKGKKGDLPGVMQQIPNVQARVVDQNQKILYERSFRFQQGNNRANFDLPPEMPINPGDRISMEFLTETPDGKSAQLIGKNELQVVAHVTHLITDRPMYRPGEIVRFRSLTLERFSLKPAQEKLHLRFRIVGPNNVEIFNKEYAGEVVTDGKKDAIKGPGGADLVGIGVGECPLPAALPEGEYTLHVSELNDRFPEEKRSFLVRRWQAPRLNKEVQFNRASYGPGEQVKMQVRVAPAQGQLPGFRNIDVMVDVDVDGNNVFKQNRQTDPDGRAEFDFALPQQIFKGAGVVSVKCNDGGNVETVVRTLPIVLRDLHVDFYPEGGDLLFDTVNRVYFQARTPAGKPADMQGAILDERKQEVVRIQTQSDDKEPGVNQGLGSFTFTPKLGKRYTLRIDAPIGIDRPITLPNPKTRGVALHIPQGVVDGEINVKLNSVDRPRELLVGAYCRGRMLDHKVVKAAAKQPVTVALTPKADVGGVYRITVFEKLGKVEQTLYVPLAERLIYRRSPTKVDVAIQADRPSYQPGEPVHLHLQARNEKREFVPAVALVAVVDSSVLKLRDDKTVRSMPTHFLLTTEVRNPEELEYADFLVSDHPQAAAALDLLLGSQGWRRFAEQNPKQFQQAKAKAQNIVPVANNLPQFLDAEQKELEKLDAGYVVQAIELQRKLGDAETKAENGPPAQLIDINQAEMNQALDQIELANMQLREIRMFLVQFGLGGVLLTLLFLGFYLISVGLRRLSEGGEARRWLVSGLALLGLLFFVSIIGTFALMGDPLVEEFRPDRFGKKAPIMAAQIGMMPPPAPALAPPVNMVEPDDMQDERVLEEVAAQKDGPVLPQKKIIIPDPGFINNFNANFNNNDAGRVGQLDALGQVENERVLRMKGDYQTIVQNHLKRRVQLPPIQEACTVREYAHQHKIEPNGIRRDFAETLCWQPVLVMPDGMGQVQFELSDSITRYQVLVVTHTQDGRLGSNVIEITSKLPFSVDPKTPIEVTQSDQISIPIAVTNSLAKKASVQLSTRGKGVEFKDNIERGLELAANQTQRVTVHAKATVNDGTASVRVTGKTDGRGDGVERSFKVVPDGFPVTGSLSGVLENQPVEHEITLPKDWIPGSLRVQAYFFPSPTAELQGGLDAILREPVGCFEQSSSSNYPNTLVLNYLHQSRDNNPAIEKRARALLQNGYAKLTAFECNDPAGGKRGYEWFGGAAPPHEALTAYGLMQFRDMAKVAQVDDTMLKRTEKYLLDQRDGKGGFKRNPAAIDQFGRAPEAVTNAYILWALTESGVKENLDPELAALRKACKASKDPYFLSLVALSHLNRKKVQEGIDILQDVRVAQQEDGKFVGAQTSITGSQGNDLAVETTSLAMLALLKANRFEFDPQLGNAVKWLGKQRRGSGGFGGTQATILALKAMVAYSERQPKAVQAGELTMFVRNAPPRGGFGGPGGMPPGAEPLQQNGFGQPQGGFGPQMQQGGFGRGGRAGNAFIEDELIINQNRAAIVPRMTEPIILTIPNVRDLQPGKNMVQLSVSGNNALPYSLTWSYRAVKPPTDPKAPVKLAAKLAAPEAKEGSTVKLTANVENASGKGQGMTVAVIGLPGGLAIPEDSQQLSELIKKKDISAWELRGRDLVLYWRDLAPDAKIAVELDLVCRLPGVYRGPASRAYLYYDADRKHWIEPLSIRITEVEPAFAR